MTELRRYLLAAWVSEYQFEHATRFRLPSSVRGSWTRQAARCLARGDIPEAFEFISSRNLKSWGMSGSFLDADDPDYQAEIAAPADLMQMEILARARPDGAYILASETVRSMRDWLVHLSRSDPRGFAKVARMSFAEAYRAQVAWHETMRRSKAEASRVNLDACPEIHRYDDGFRWVWVRTPEQLDAEGLAMRHCVGHGSYDRLTRQDAILSLRDPSGAPVVTVQLSGRALIQAYGVGNSEAPETDRIADLRSYCGSYLLLHERPGWATRSEIDAATTQLKLIEDLQPAKIRELQQMLDISHAELLETLGTDPDAALARLSREAIVPTQPGTPTPFHRLHENVRSPRQTYRARR